jgi:hypothetical protein
MGLSARVADAIGTGTFTSVKELTAAIGRVIDACD